MKPGLAARAAALAAVNGVKSEGNMLSEAGLGGGLSAPDRARAMTLATAILRYHGRADRLLETYLNDPPPELVQDVLRLATVELLVEDLPPHAVVDAAVDLIKQNPETERFAGLVNAVSRRIAREGAPIWAKTKPQTLPPWLRKRLRKTHGKGVVVAIEAAHERGAPVDLTVKDPARASEITRRLGAELLPTGSVRLRDKPQISKLEGYEQGEWWVQDAAAAIPARLLGDLSGKRALDLCAAPGGKTLQLAATGAKVTAVDLSERRLKRLHENLTRTRLSANVVVGDATSFVAEDKFDAILVDAPCSATGTIRRHPELPFIRQEADLNALVELQFNILRHAATLLAPQGKIVYCTCSLLREEGEEQIERFLAEHPGFSCLNVDPPLFGLDADWIGEFGVRLRPDYWPEIAGMDGFFVAVLQRN